MNTVSQQDVILEHLQRGGRLTGIQAIGLCGSMKLATRVSELRKQGYDIKDTWVTSDNSRFKEYYMEAK